MLSYELIPHLLTVVATAGSSGARGQERAVICKIGVGRDYDSVIVIFLDKIARPGENAVGSGPQQNRY